jgi:hypothetical protein
VLSNQRFKLTKPALALDVVVRQGWITIPAGEIIRVLAGPNGEENKMIDVLWEGRMLTMYAINVTAGCKAIRDGSAGAISSGASGAPGRQSHDRSRK